MEKQNSLYFPYPTNNKRAQQAAMRHYRPIPGQSAFIKAVLVAPPGATIGQLMAHAKTMDWRMS